MLGFVARAARRPLAILSGGLLVGSTLIGATATPAAAADPVAHWGNYQWSGGAEKADVRAFWLFDRTGNTTMNAIIQHVADAWNGARADHPQLPYIAVYRDDANAGKCFVNRTPGYSVASACMMRSLSAFGIKGLAATDGSPHFGGAAFAVSDGLSFKEAFTVVCHNFGHIMGLADSNDDQSCMKHDFSPDKLKWYGQGDAEAVLGLYGHGEGQPATAVGDEYATDEDTPLAVGAPGVLGNDTDAHGNTLTATRVSEPANGTVTLNADGSFTYTPDDDFEGEDSFTYKATAGGLDSNVATVKITVAAVSDAPVAAHDAYSTDEDTALTIGAPGVLDNDSDPEDDTITAVGASDPENGTVTLNSDGSFTYTPDDDFAGTDSFTYKASDGSNDSDKATVKITVKAVNDAPAAADDSYTTNQAVPLVVTAPGVLGNDTDVEGSPLTAQDASDPANGSVTLNADGSFTYTPDPTFHGEDTFTYKASDGTTTSSVATVKITVEAALAPVPEA
jgi:VCBS repeat-containing protein